jgi:DNA-binding CsgD family transcriptional regulator
MSYYRWSEEEEEYLEYYIRSEDTIDYEAASEHLGIPIEKIYSKAHYMRKKNQLNHRLKEPYSERELNMIKQNYQIMTYQEIADLLDRSLESVRSTANKKLGLRKTRPIKKHDKDIKRLAKQGKFAKKIAEYIGASHQATADYMRLNGIDYKRVPYELRTREMRKIQNLTFKK